ncbi:ATP synthase regulation protein NCA2-domain-containing protein [Cladorrhinum samala]|uniref:ATP synthase regulation protein NCA2-domain-containing protein n=1 Tax=Cladorrhinum samala TaxID=585594 RepID=A0AAV9HUD4_9PEZI|nr:ATP synthase regulation protein NCA2-domain-containing protein [Cladorrhinum samala]
MSIVADHVRRLDARIDQISLIPLGLGEDQDEQFQGVDRVEVSALTSPRVTQLLRISKAFSPSASSGAGLPAWRIEDLLIKSGLAETEDEEAFKAKMAVETDVEWLLVGKATVQTYGLLMDTLLDQITPLSDDIWYWDEVLSSYPNSLLYTTQSSPLRLCKWAREIFNEVLDRVRQLRHAQLLEATQQAESNYEPSGSGAISPTQVDGEGGRDRDTDHDDDQRTEFSKATSVGSLRPRLSSHWRQYYKVVRESIAERSLTDFRHKILSRVDIGRSEARRKLARLQRLREMTAAGLGVLLDEGLDLGTGQDEAAYNDEWRGVLERSVALMDMILQGVLKLDSNVSDFEERVFAGVEDDPELSVHIDDVPAAARPAILARRLLSLLQEGIPSHVVATSQLSNKYGRPSRLVRYWVPAVALLLSSSTILRLLFNRQDDIVTWIRDFGATTRDFWFNWVVEPVRKVIGTIRHDSNEEIAIMSRDSLKADRESLERMVVDFALDYPEFAAGNASVSQSELVDIRSKVREGDVTPVLRAYEKGLRHPFVAAVKGNLVRSLLVQVQKTKVDLEVAISGIDALLKSQELVFGFIGLTPGILVSVGIFQYLKTVFGGRKGMRHSKKARRSVRVLRRMDKILSKASSSSQNNFISYRDHGLLVCEVHVLRQLAYDVLPGDVQKEFIEDLDELASLRVINMQIKVLERIRWAYAEWLSKMR